jgi:ABC-2 type transport system ATP-binding protein
VNTNLLMEIILEYHKRGHTIVFSTHMMEQVEKLCERICLFNRGRVVLEGELAAIKRSYGKGGVSIRFTGDGTFLAGLPEVESFNDYGNEAFLRLHDGASATRILDAARERLEVTRFEVAEPSIHDIFIERVQST